MVGKCRTWVFLAGFLPALAPAMSRIHVEGAQVGQRVLEITIDDSILTPDLSKLTIEGYEIEEAVFIDQAPFELNPQYFDLTAPGVGKVVEFLPTPGVLVLDLPARHIPHAGHVFGDTALGGFLRKVVKVDGAPLPGQIGQRWTLTTVEADLGEAIRTGELSFSTRLDMNQAFPDMDRAEEVLGYLPDGSAHYVDAEYGLREAQVLFQPLVAGRLRVAAGKVEDFSVSVQGDCEVAAEARGVFHGRGEFQYEDELPERAPRILPLGHGLFLRVRSRPFLRMEAEAAGAGFSAQADFRVRNSLRSEIVYSGGQWRPLAENRMTHANKAVQELWGQGSLKLSLKPRMEFMLAGMQGPAITFEPYARFTSSDDAKSWIWKSEGVRQPAGGNPLKDAALLSHGNKEVSLGSHITMEARTTFTGPAVLRSFLLFSREQTVLSPPREGSLVLKEGDSGRINLTAVTFPKADRYIIQHRIGNGPWETFGEQAALARIRLGNLKPSTAYRFRAIGVNAMGAGPAFPPEGLPYTTPTLNHPPVLPFALRPDSGAVVATGNPVLSWRGGDPDPGNKVLYSVLLDTRNPPLATRAHGLADTSLPLADLKPGATYFWRVISTDGRETVEGPVRAFTVPALVAEPGSPPPGEAPDARPYAGYPMVALPRGTFQREDGRTVTVGPFLIGKYEVRQGEYERIAGRNPSYRLQDSLPVERVTWEEAESFCREIGGRLPTEAEWEYAARAGTSTPYYWGAGNPAEYAWFRENSEDRTQKVGQLKPNAWGLHDVAGNVFEWVQDWYGDYPDAVDHPRGAESGTAKVIRGASWYSEGGNLGLGSRYNNRPGFRNFKVGFRCARDGEPLEDRASGRPAALPHPLDRGLPAEDFEAASATSASAAPVSVQAAPAAGVESPGRVEAAARPAGPLPLTSPIPYR